MIRKIRKIRKQKGSLQNADNSNPAVIPFPMAEVPSSLEEGASFFGISETDFADYASGTVFLKECMNIFPGNQKSLGKLCSA